MSPEEISLAMAAASKLQDCELTALLKYVMIEVIRSDEIKALIEKSAERLNQERYCGGHCEHD